MFPPRDLRISRFVTYTNYISPVAAFPIIIGKKSADVRVHHVDAIVNAQFCTGIRLTINSDPNVYDLPQLVYQ